MRAGGDVLWVQLLEEDKRDVLSATASVLTKA